MQTALALPESLDSRLKTGARQKKSELRQFWVAFLYIIYPDAYFQKMILDIDKSFGEIHPDEATFKQQLEALSKLTRQSHELRKWAKNLRFITSHPDSRISGQDQGPDKPLHTAPQTVFHGKDDEGNPRSEIIGGSAQPCGFNAWSRYPIDSQDRKLLVTGREAAPSCTHYVAVSYCGPQPDDSQPSPLPAYQLFAGTDQKSNDCRNEVLERSTKFAGSLELSAVWIDQQCINQEDREDKESGIQSMDLVYEIAQVSVGLLSLTIEEQLFLDFLDVDRFNSFQFESREQLTDLLRFVRWLDNERWFTRAWCMQESWSAGPKMLLMFKHASGLDKSPSLGDTDGEALVNFQIFGVILQAMLTKLESREELFNDTPLDKAWLQRFRRKVITVLPPRAQDAAMVIGSRNRLRCSAAEGLHFLAVRENSRIVDRLAILGNLCDFSVRLDANQIDDSAYGFSTCAFALAILNGDTSLMDCLPLTPSQPTQQPINSVVSSPGALSFDVNDSKLERLGYSWGPPVTGILTNLEWVPEGITQGGCPKVSSQSMAWRRGGGFSCVI